MTHDNDLVSRAEAIIHAAMCKMVPVERHPGDSAIVRKWAREAATEIRSALTTEAGGRPRPLDEWHEDMGDCVWWCWRDGAWLGEPAMIGKPLDSAWPDYHTHFTPHPKMPAPPATEGEA